MSNRPEDSRGRWWEVRGEGQPDEGGRRELMTDSRGRSRPERSLSAGADLADEPRHRAPAFLWPVVSLVAAVGLILSVIYVSKDKSTSTASATSAEPAAQGSTHDDGAPPPDLGAQRSVPPAPSGNLPAADGGASLTDTRAAVPRGPAVDPSGPVGAPSDSSDGAGREGRNQPTETSTPSAAAPGPVPKLDGRAPAAPGPQPARQKVSGTGGCTISETSEYYDCTIEQSAPYYLAETADPRGPLRANRYPFFVCQSAGSKYSVENRANYWWAWLRMPLISGVWVPVVFLKGGPDNAPAPGLPVCGSAPTPSPASTTSPSTGPAAMNIVDRQTGRCLDSNDKGEVYALECNGGDYQKWVGGNDGTVRDKQTGRCLDSNEKGEVYALECNGGNYQKWERHDDSTIRDKQTGRCLDSNDNGNVYTLDCNGGNYQKWDIK